MNELPDPTRNPVTREDLMALLDPSGDDRHIGRNWAGMVLHPKQAAAITDAILAVLHPAPVAVPPSERGRSPQHISDTFYGFIKRAADEGIEPEDWDLWALTALWNAAQIEAGLTLYGIPTLSEQVTLVPEIPFLMREILTGTEGTS